MKARPAAEVKHILPSIYAAYRARSPSKKTMQSFFFMTHDSRVILPRFMVSGIIKLRRILQIKDQFNSGQKYIYYALVT